MTPPFELPESWCWKSLDEVASISGGLTLNSSVRSSATEWAPLVTVAAVQLRAINSQGIRSVGLIPSDGEKGSLLSNDLLVVEGNGSIEHIGRVALWDGSVPDARHQNHLIRVRPSGVSPRYALEWLASPPGRSLLIEAATTTAGLYNLSISKLGRVKIPVAPPHEQGRIVAKIEALQARTSKAREALEGVPALLEQYRQSVLAAAFRGDLTADWRESHPDVEPASVLLDRIRQERRRRWETAELARMKSPPRDDRWKAKYQEPDPVDESDLPELPEGWCWANLLEVTSAVEPICYGVVQPGDEVADGVPLVRVCDINAGDVDVAGLRRISPSVDHEYSRTRLKGGEVLVTVVGTIGRLAVAPPSLQGANIARAVARLVPLEEVSSEWILHWLSTSRMQGWLVSESREVARKTLNIKELEQAVVPLAPAPEMRLILNRLRSVPSSTARIRAQADLALSELARVEQAVLSRAFRGELVAHDPVDEPSPPLPDRDSEDRSSPNGRGTKLARQRRLTGFD